MLMFKHLVHVDGLRTGDDIIEERLIVDISPFSVGAKPSIRDAIVDGTIEKMVDTRLKA